jgi:hypothetical protein
MRPDIQQLPYHIFEAIISYDSRAFKEKRQVGCLYITWDSRYTFHRICSYSKISFIFNNLVLSMDKTEEDENLRDIQAARNTLKLFLARIVPEFKNKFLRRFIIG